MQGKDFNEVIGLITRDDPRYQRGAYIFVRKALDHTLKNLQKEQKDRPSNHVSGQELLEGVRQYALEQYGPMAYLVLVSWGLRQCADVGHIVFNLVDYGVFGKTDNDTLDDFTEGYDFAEAFAAPFAPRRKAPPVVLADDDAPDVATPPIGGSNGVQANAA